ncbi:MAG: hypothetical protein J5519_07930 [Bacteroidales bacterium]|jgi:hypothetical protein|nr:hypothetical protein [Bacteroidales bacterium]
MASEQVRGHLAIAAAYSIFGLNVVLCKDIANSAVVSPYVLFTLRAIGASALFWLVSIFSSGRTVALRYPRSYIQLWQTRGTRALPVSYPTPCSSRQRATPPDAARP